MAWSKVYTGGTGGGTANHDFFVYFFDTYLSAKTGWSTGAHPDSSAYKRKVSFTADNAVTGSPHTMYYWFSWGNTSGTSNTIWYLDGTYTTTPGDLCTYTSANGLEGDQEGEWTIWESGVDSSEFAVYNGRVLWFYWPATTKITAWDAGTWDGTGDTHRGRTSLWPGGSMCSQYANPCYIGGSVNSNARYYLVPDCGFDASTASTAPGLTGEFPIVFQGIQWMATETTTTSIGGLSIESYPVISRGPSDTVFKMGSTSSDTRQFGTINNPTAYILQDTTSGKYYLHHTSSLTDNCVMFDCGTTEPVLNA